MNFRKQALVLTMIGTLIYPICAQTNAGEQKDKNTLITIHAEDAFLPSILAILAKESGYNIVTDPNVNKQDKVSIHLDEVPIEQAINLVVRAVGLSYEVVGNSFLVADPKKLKEEVGVTSYVITLKYSAAEDVKNLLQDISDQVQVDIPGNKLLVNASPKKIAEIIRVVETIDVPAIQIMLETRLIEVAADVEEQLGIDWSKISSYKTILAEGGVPITDGGGSVIPDDQTFGALPVTMPFNRLSGIFKKDKTTIIPKYFSRQLTAFDLTLNMLQKNNQAEVLADSRLTTINGREASIKLVDIVPYILSSGGVGGQVQVQREEVGIKLNILPTVNTDGYITVKVEPEVSTIFEFIGPDANIPRVKSRTSSTTIRVRDGESIVIGGLLSNDRKQTTYQMPVLHKIPWLGKKLFTSTGIIERKTDLIIQITPKIVVDDYTGITKSDEMQKYEDYVIYGTPSDTSASASDDEHELNESDDEPDSEEGE
ncbi:MAG: secretin N-terminal domain-containing protein [Candidatus Neomarinimicrobiota bacterium]|nr:secretin N-terminal domain-containing protein [Candidatus Neomarinimicrobiota bacterium]